MKVLIEHLALNFYFVNRKIILYTPNNYFQLRKQGVKKGLIMNHPFKGKVSNAEKAFKNFIFLTP